MWLFASLYILGAMTFSFSWLPGLVEFIYYWAHDMEVAKAAWEGVKTTLTCLVSGGIAAVVGIVGMVVVVAK